jgi:WD40 repeat protein
MGEYSRLLLIGKLLMLILCRNEQPLLLVTTADKRVHLLDAKTNTLQASHTTIYDAPALSASRIGDNTLVTSSMSGQLHLSDLSGESFSTRRDHSKYIVKVAVFEDGLSGSVIATAGWDNKVVIYKLDDSTSDNLNLDEPSATIALQTKPEGMVFVRHPETNQPVLILSRTDSNNIFFYTVEPQPRLLGQQNLAPHSNAWVAFTPSALEICPTDPTLLAVGTSSIPHMKLLLVRLLFPPWESELPRPAPTALRSSRLDDVDDGAPALETHASQARADRVVAE